MKELKGRTAFITGGASGLGLSMARAFGAQGMNVMIADIEQAALNAALEDLKGRQIKCAGVLCNVAHRDQLRDAALKTIAQFGKVHVLCNNAGVGAGGVVGQVPERDWDWIIDVNLKAVVHGMDVFLPLIKSHGEGGHVVNTASMAGMISPPAMEPYNATKFAVVAMSEGWQMQLAAENIGVSALCPGFVRTRIHESRRNRPDEYGADEGSEVLTGAAAQLVNSGIDPDAVGARVVEAILANELYIFTHPEMRPLVEQRFARILEGFDVAARSPALKGQVAGLAGNALFEAAAAAAGEQAAATLLGPKK
ncbi:MAG TPA: short-chain dehydrogenase [Alphaproteobacteria bacterium]|nr:short-chain dehydrogenase [Alphaproteobacteria bacterium]